jgi:hypothetical protein
MHSFYFRVAEFPFLLLTTNSLQNRYLTVSFLMSHGLTTSRVMGPFFGRKPTLMNGGERVCQARFMKDAVHDRLGQSRPEWVCYDDYINMTSG